ncbi:MAG: hypothetical protein ACJ788_13830, partial [Ktedonobacteraceae bacterium]
TGEARSVKVPTGYLDTPSFAFFVLGARGDAACHQHKLMVGCDEAALRAASSQPNISLKNSG